MNEYMNEDMHSPAFNWLALLKACKINKPSFNYADLSNIGYASQLKIS